MSQINQTTNVASPSDCGETNTTKLQKSPSLSSIASNMSNLINNELQVSQDNTSKPISGSDNKYNISNVLKHIYQIKYFQKSNNIPSVPSTINSTNTILTNTGNAETNTTKQFWMPVNVFLILHFFRT